MRRRQFMREAVRLIGYGIALATGLPRSLLARDTARPRWRLRRIRSGDEGALTQLMRVCVEDDGAFHGRCRAMEWTAEWAGHAIRNSPSSLVVTRDDEVIAYLDLPDKKPRDSSRAVERNQEAFWCGAGGVRADLLTPADTLRVFRHLLYRTFIEAQRAGFRSVRCAAPWPKHPNLPTSFADYPGLTLTSFTTDDGELRYLIDWRLSDAIAALKAEGAVDALT